MLGDLGVDLLAQPVIEARGSNELLKLDAERLDLAGAELEGHLQAADGLLDAR